MRAAVSGLLLALAAAVTSCSDSDSGSDAARGGAGSGGSAGNGPGVEGCSLTLPGATGDEPGAAIPVCCTASAADQAGIDELLLLLNAHRASNGRPALSYDTELAAAMQGHCMHMASHDFFDHMAPESSVDSPWTRAELCGTSASAENIAQNPGDPADVMESWIGSSGHNANMLSSEYTRVGICHYEDYWGLIFD